MSPKQNRKYEVHTHIVGELFAGCCYGKSRARVELNGKRMGEEEEKKIAQTRKTTCPNPRT